jgi:ABC-type polysaccharide/polyol phosphate transport system ATPase subunit
MIAVEVENLSKRFRRQTVQPHTTMKSVMVDWFRRQRRPVGAETFEVLSDITLRVRQGQTLGIIGRNGSGKSTLLKVLAGIYRPDQGKIWVHGRMGALLELGAGFHPEFSGRENVLINGIMLGLSKREVRQRFDAIVRFADLEEFIDEPVKTYSSGMYMRLGFAVAVHADPDVLLIDELLAVGDDAFQQKCADKIAEFRQRGKTIILVSHDLGGVERWSDTVLWLDHGKIRGQGEPRRVIDLYREDVVAQEEKVALTEYHRLEDAMHETSLTETLHRWGSQEVTLTSVCMFDTSGAECYVYRSGEKVRIALGYCVQRLVEEPVFGIAILRKDGLWCYGSNTDIERIPIPPLAKQGTIEIVLERLDLLTGSYYLDVAVHARNGYPYDYHHQIYSFAVRSELQEAGVFRVPHHWAIKPLPQVVYQQDALA